MNINMIMQQALPVPVHVESLTVEKAGLPKRSDFRVPSCAGTKVRGTGRAAVGCIRHHGGTGHHQAEAVPHGTQVTSELLAPPLCLANQCASYACFTRPSATFPGDCITQVDGA